MLKHLLSDQQRELLKYNGDQIVDLDGVLKSDSSSSDEDSG